MSETMRERIVAGMAALIPMDSPLGRNDLEAFADTALSAVRGELLVAIDLLQPIGRMEYQHGFDTAKAALRSVVETTIA